MNKGNLADMTIGFVTVHGARGRGWVRQFMAMAVLFCLLVTSGTALAGGAYPFCRPGQPESIDPAADTVVGAVREYVVKKDETLLDIARTLDLGYLEIILLHPDIDPWLPPEGKGLFLPTAWVLPPVPTGKRAIVINIPELRLYLFFNDINMVKTFPLGLGVLDSPTPFGHFTIVEMTKDPIWSIPSSLQEKYGRQTIPPGPDNPLGKYRLRLSRHDYGIHGTNSPWGVGRLVSHGCIRLYPEDIEELFSLVTLGTPVSIIYEPVKIGFKEGRIFVEVHPDLYNEIDDLLIYTARKLFVHRIWEEVDLDLLVQALEEHRGIPIDITKNK